MKTALWDSRGAPVAEAAASYDLDRPDAARAEIDPERWWDALCGTVADVLAAAGVPARDVAAVAVDGIGWTLVPVDDAFRALTPAMTWLDRRAEGEAAALRAGPGAAHLIDLVANPLDAAYITPKLAWLRANEPAIFEATRWFLTASGFLTARLTGEATCDLTQAYGFHCFDIRRERWDEAAAAELGIPLDRLPPLREAREIAGGVGAAAAARTGLAPGTPVLVGGLDAAVGALGGGVTRHGQTQDQGGQAGGMGMSVAEVVVEPRLIFSHHVLRGQYLLQAGTVGGGALGWFRQVVGTPGRHLRVALRGGRDGGCRQRGPRVPAVPRRRANADLEHVGARRVPRPVVCHDSGRDAALDHGGLCLRRPRQPPRRGGDGRPCHRVARDRRSRAQPGLEPDQGRRDRAAARRRAAGRRG